MNEEKIGNVILDLSYYKGSDAYSDGESVEDRLLGIVKSGEDIAERLAAGDDWAELYHLSDIRKNILSWTEADKNASALEIGSGCGAVSGILCEKFGQVTAVDLSKKRSTINAYRNQSCDNLRIMVGNFEDVKFTEKFDVITLIGVFEYSIYYISSDDPFVDMLKKCRSLLNDGGRLYIAIENKYGMKYFAGASEDHTGKPYDGIEGYHGVERVRTFSGYALNAMLKAAGFTGLEFRYPVPDYKLPMEIYSDLRLPAPGDITYRSPNYDRDRYDSFDEVRVTDQVCADGMFPDFANSFMITAYNGNEPADGGCIYAKFNTLRDKPYRVDTKMMAEGGKLYAVKTPACKEALPHIDTIVRNKDLAKDFYKTIKIADLTRRGNDLYFEFINGNSLYSECLDYSSADLEDIRKDINEHLDMLIDDISDTYECSFEITDKFKEVFGDIKLPEDLPGLKKANADMIFGNFIRTEDGLVCIDYEWFFDFPVPKDFLRYRVARCIFESFANISTRIKTRQEFAVFLGIDTLLVDAFDEMEDKFQVLVTGGGLGRDTLTKYGKKFERVEELLKDKESEAARIAELERIVALQQAHIDKMKHAIKNPLFGMKWALEKVFKKK